MYNIYHLLSGDSDESLISTSHQETFISLICGLVSLTIQYLINFLKGQVISSPYARRMHPSNCAANFCKTKGNRWRYLTKEYQEGDMNLVILKDEKHSYASIIEENTNKGGFLGDY